MNVGTMVASFSRGSQASLTQQWRTNTRPHKELQQCALIEVIISAFPKDMLLPVRRFPFEPFKAFGTLIHFYVSSYTCVSRKDSGARKKPIWIWYYCARSKMQRRNGYGYTLMKDILGRTSDWIVSWCANAGAICKSTQFFEKLYLETIKQQREK